MKKLIIIQLLFTISLFAEIEWEDYDSAFEVAKEDGKAVMVMFSSPTCKVCKYMKRKVYTDKAVAKYLDEHFISVEIDYNDNPDTTKFKLLGTPNYFFLDAQGKLIQPKMIGGAKAKNFLTILQSVIKKSEAK